MSEAVELVSGREFLRKICAMTGVSGTEDSLGDAVERHFAPLIDESRRDVMGNVIMLKRGGGSDPPVLMFAAHMDEIGLVVTKVQKRGFLRFAAVGGVDPRNLLAAEVTVLGRRNLPGVIGVKPPHLISADERKKAISMEDLYIDVGLDQEAAREQVEVGDPVVLSGAVRDLCGDRLAGKAMDDRAGVAALYAAARRLNRLRHEADVYLVATVQEEVGLRGAITSTYDILPDIGIAVDVTTATAPGLSAHQGNEMGGGPAIGQGANIHPLMHRRLREICDAERIPHQEEILPARSGTDAWAMQVTQSGVPTAVISIPLRYMHTTVEMLSGSDVDNAGELLAHFAASADRQLLEGFYADAT